MEQIMAQMRLKWIRGERRKKRNTPRLAIYPWLYEMEVFETRGRAIITDNDGFEYAAEYKSYGDVIHDLDLLKSEYILQIKKRAGRSLPSKGKLPGDPDGHTAA